MDKSQLSVPQSCLDITKNKRKGCQREKQERLYEGTFEAQ